MRLPILPFLIGLLFLAVPVAAEPEFQSSAPTALMVDFATGTVLYEKNADKKIAPASMTKMMTAYVVFEEIATGKISLDTQFIVRPETWQKWHGVGSTMFLKANEKVTVSNLLHGLDTLSGNDAAIVLAEGVSGNQAAFVQRMNDMAALLGMKDSHFGTPNGWPDGGKTKTTAHDLALLGAKTITNFPELYRAYYGQPTFRWNGVTQPNRDPILGKIEGADGMKTGHTNEAGYCFTGSAVQDGRRIIMVVAGLPTAQDRVKESIRFMQWGFSSWEQKLAVKEGEAVIAVPVQLGTETEVPVVTQKPLSMMIHKSRPSYRMAVRYKGPIKAPIRKGSEIAKLVAIFDDGREEMVPLVAIRSVHEASFFGRAWNGLNSLVNL